MKNNQSDTIERIREMQVSLGLNQVQMAAYLGVPHSTLCNWLGGDRSPNTVVARLVEVLGTIKTFAPGVHACLMPGKVE